jgi:ABC-type lipoprotein export system ATPase subunit
MSAWRFRKKVGLRRQNEKNAQGNQGEQQSAVIARALLNDPELILADEPTGSRNIRKKIMILLRQISQSGNGSFNGNTWLSHHQNSPLVILNAKVEK